MRQAAWVTAAHRMAMSRSQAGAHCCSLHHPQAHTLSTKDSWVSRFCSVKGRNEPCHSRIHSQTILAILSEFLMPFTHPAKDGQNVREEKFLFGTEKAEMRSGKCGRRKVHVLPKEQLEQLADGGGHVFSAASRAKRRQQPAIGRQSRAHAMAAALGWQGITVPWASPFGHPNPQSAARRLPSGHEVSHSFPSLTPLRVMGPKKYVICWLLL